MTKTQKQGGALAPKALTGIIGLDSVTLGGIPVRGITIIDGGPGAGKTVLALQSLVYAARHLREPGIFVAFEENSSRIIAHAASFGWDVPALQPKKLFFLDAQPSIDAVESGAFDLGGMLAALDAKIDQIGARRIVFDAIDAVLSMLDFGAERRELYRLGNWITTRGLTTIVTSKTAFSASGQQRGEFLQFMADCAISLDHCVVHGVSERSLRVLKYRGSDFHENEAPCVIGSSGFEVASVNDPKTSNAPATSERISTGVERLDTMLGGGFFRNAGILATGAPGTAKTTLGGAFAEAACLRHEATLFVSFDSEPAEVIRNLSSVGIRLGRHVGTARRPGLLRMFYQRALDGSAETHSMQVQNLVREHGARCLVIDPLSALGVYDNDPRAQNVAKRLLNWAKAQGITVFCTSLLEGGALDFESSPLHISTIADTWMHLSYIARNGERNRCLSIVKSRGTAHSNQVRELLLSEHGITLADAYTAGGEVLLGTLRWERERANDAARHDAEQLEHVNKLKLLSEEADLNAQLAAIQRQLEAKRAELKTSKTNLETHAKVARVDKPGGSRGVAQIPRPRIVPSEAQMKPADLFNFRLYITGHAPDSVRAMANLTNLCHRHLPDRHHIEVIDLLLHPQRALSDGVFRTPTLVKLAPGPEVRIVGSLSNLHRFSTASD